MIFKFILLIFFIIHLWDVYDTFLATIDDGKNYFFLFFLLIKQDYKNT